MSQDEKFTHITVTPEEDEFVLRAGVPTTADQEPVRQMAEKSSVEHAEVATSDGQNIDQSDRVSQNANQSEEVKQKTSNSSSGYQPTTLEDLSSVKMSTMQKTIIILAVIAVAAFVAYYFIM